MNLYVQLEFSSQGLYLYFLLFFQNIESVHKKVKNAGEQSVTLKIVKNFTKKWLMGLTLSLFLNEI